MIGNWWKEGIVYQVYPRSFMDSNGDGIGDIPGLISKLDYLQNLGVNILWLNPVYESPNDDNGYDIANYQSIMAEFGTLADFDELLTQMHQRGMKLIMDLVVNHCSDEHPWFQQARQSKDNPYRDYFIWQPEKDGGAPNNWVSVFSGSAWQKTEETGEYYLHLFSKKQPDLNWENPKLRQEIFDMMNWWFEKGVDGFRMDVINMISKVPGYPGVENAEAGELVWGGQFFMNGPKLHDYLQELNQKVLSRWDCMTVGECFDVDIEEGLKLVGEDRNELHMIFQMEHMNLDSGPDGKWQLTNGWSLVEMKRILNRWALGLEGKGWNSQFLMNHDQPRALSRFGNDGEFRRPSAKCLATLTLTLPGTPYVYQGEEIGMTNVAYDIDEYRDLETLNWYEEKLALGWDKDDLMRSIHAKGRDNSRTPMQWTADIEAGFTQGQPWLKVNPNHKEINAAAEQEHPDSIFHYYQTLIQLRKDHKDLVYGRFDLLLPDHEQLFCYQRKGKVGNYLVLLNFSDEEQALPESFDLKGEELINNLPGQTGFQLLPWQARVLFQSWK